MVQMHSGFSTELLEKLIPWANQPVGEHAITALTAGMDGASKLKLKETLKNCWRRCYQPVDHRQSGEAIIEVVFAKYTHFIATSAMVEFERLKKLYNQEFTLGLKQAIDEFVVVPGEQVQASPQKHPQPKKRPREKTLTTGWRIGASDVRDFRRRNGERLMLVSKVGLEYQGHRFLAKTANISSGGCLVRIDPQDLPCPSLCGEVGVEYIELSEKYTLAPQWMCYQVVNFKPLEQSCQLALKRVEKDGKEEFDQLIAHLMNEHRRRNRLDVDNTVKALSARCFNLSATAQLNALMVLSHYQDQYHFLINLSQNDSQHQHLVHEAHLLPYLSENTATGVCHLFFVWTDNQNRLYVAELKDINRQPVFETMLGHWRKAQWHKVFLVKADTLDPQLADLGTSLPCDVATIVSKLNAPLPVNVARLSQELAKITLIEDVTDVVDVIAPGKFSGKRSGSQLARFKLANTHINKRSKLKPVSFKEAGQPSKLDSALRNLILSNLPKVAIFADVRKRGVAPVGLTGHQYLPEPFIDDSRRVKLDLLFSQQILLKLANCEGHHKDILFVAMTKGKVTERYLLSQFMLPKLLLNILKRIKKSAELYIFILDVGQARERFEDVIVTIEHKYLSHYSPAKAKKLDASLKYNLSIQMVEVSEQFSAFFIP